MKPGGNTRGTYLGRYDEEDDVLHEPQAALGLLEPAVDDARLDLVLVA